MPNIYITRSFIKSTDQSIIKSIVKKHFQKGKMLEGFPILPTDVITNSGKIEISKNEIAFSNFCGWHIHEPMQLSIAKLLPVGATFTVTGFDWDDYPTKTGGDVLIFSCGPKAKLKKSKQFNSRLICKKFFPIIYKELERRLQDEKLCDNAHKLFKKVYPKAELKTIDYEYFYITMQKQQKGNININVFSELDKKTKKEMTDTAQKILAKLFGKKKVYLK